MNLNATVFMRHCDSQATKIQTVLNVRRPDVCSSREAKDALCQQRRQKNPEAPANEEGGNDPQPCRQPQRIFWLPRFLRRPKFPTTNIIISFLSSTAGESRVREKDFGKYTLK